MFVEIHRKPLSNERSFCMYKEVLTKETSNRANHYILYIVIFVQPYLVCERKNQLKKGEKINSKSHFGSTCIEKVGLTLQTTILIKSLTKSFICTIH